MMASNLQNKTLRNTAGHRHKNGYLGKHSKGTGNSNEYRQMELKQAKKFLHSKGNSQ